MGSEPSERLESTWQDLGLDPDAATVLADGTIAQRDPRATDQDMAPPLPTLMGAIGHDEVQLGEILGEGGMGFVHAATQTSMQRQVAVKVLRPELRHGAAGALLREALVTGALEHPNIVPVHAVGVDAERRPLIVMKRLQGRSWLDRLRETAGSPAELDAELDVLEQVAAAVAFAHERGVLHRDIKPDNVFLGDDGAVYLVDWGLALDLGGAGIPGLPLVGETCGISGTVQYMAPEQAEGRPGSLGAHTDVFLLGASLYHVLCGRPPNELPSDPTSMDIRQILLRVYCGRPVRVPGWVPDELASICERAIDPDPLARFPDAASFRDAIITFRTHRESMAVTEEAEARLGRAAAILDDPVASETVRIDSLGGLLAQARFGFEQALRSWPDNPRALSGHEETLVRMIQQAMNEQRLDAAGAILEELRGEHATLRERLSRLKAELTARRKRVDALEAAAYASDLGEAARDRRRYGLGLGATMLVAHLIMFGLPQMLAGVAVTHAVYLAVTSVIGVAFAAPSLVRFRAMYPNLANRRFILSLGLLLVAQVLVFCALWAYGLSLPATLAVSLFQLAGQVAIKTTVLDERATWTSVVILGCAVVASLVPWAAVPLVGVAYATYFVAGALLQYDEGAPSPRLLEEATRKGTGTRAPS